jgi:hypothetical protein
VLVYDVGALHVPRAVPLAKLLKYGKPVHTQYSQRGLLSLFA